MNKYFVLTIDVEPDCTPSWRYRNPLSFLGVSRGLASILQPLFEEYQIRPTYLINNVVLEDHGSVEVFKSFGSRCELGTHLHAEFVEPEKQYSDYAGKEGIARQCLYPPEVERAKLESITRMFVDAFGYAPTSFRAGRFSAQGNTIHCLKELGYLVDTSVTPHVLWEDDDQPLAIDFRGAPEQPYFPREGSITAIGKNNGLLEVPVSIVLLYPWLLKRWQLRPLRKCLRKQAVWLRPGNCQFEDMRRLTENYSRRYGGQDNVVFNMMFHNVEVLPEFSPYVLNDQDSHQYLDTLRRYFEYLNAEGIKSLTLSEFYDVHCGGRKDNPATKYAK
ncbi:MAG: hypothetical protein FIA97_07470 [Methylococcaceae bacterium]|nr:hypothetical protein [Methylococcaceae bacterium]